jgi:hypothetical protein
VSSLQAILCLEMGRAYLPVSWTWYFDDCFTLRQLGATHYELHLVEVNGFGYIRLVGDTQSGRLILQRANKLAPSCHTVK